MNRTVTMVNQMEVSRERVEEIFETPKTAEMLQQFLEEKTNKEKIKKLVSRVISAVGSLSKKEVEAEIAFKIKGYILMESMESIVNGKTLDEAVQSQIQSQMEKNTVFESVEDDIKKLEERCGFLDVLLKNLFC